MCLEGYLSIEQGIWPEKATTFIHSGQKMGWRLMGDVSEKGMGRAELSLSVLRKATDVGLAGNVCSALVIRPVVSKPRRYERAGRKLKRELRTAGPLALCSEHATTALPAVRILPLRAPPGGTTPF